MGVVEFFNSPNFSFRKTVSPFHIAAHSGIIELFEKISLSKNGNVNVTDSFGWTPLHFAVWCSHFETSKIIIEKSGIKNSADNRGNTPLHLAAKYGYSDICNLIIEKAQLLPEIFDKR